MIKYDFILIYIMHERQIHARGLVLCPVFHFFIWETGWPAVHLLQTVKAELLMETNLKLWPVAQQLLECTFNHSEKNIRKKNVG